MHALTRILRARVRRTAQADARLFTNCLNGHYSANFLFGNADSRIAELPHMHNILRRSLAPLYILRLLRAHTMPSIVLLVFTVFLLYAVTSIIVRV